MVITVKGECQEVVATIASSGTDELPVAVTVHRADCSVDEVLVFPDPAGQQG